MTNEELKKKIVEILDNNIRWQPYYYISRGIVYEDDLKNIADALIAAEIGDVTEWKERAEKEKDEKNMWKCTANDWKQRFESRDKQYNDRIVSSCKALQLKDEKIAKYKRRAEVVERALHCLARSFAEAMCKDGNTHHLIDGFIKDAYRQAKKEFAEEKKDDERPKKND